MTATPLFAALLLTGLSDLAGLAADPAQPGAVSAQEGNRLCILDLNRLGGDERHDWLGRGLADMLIVRMSRLSDFQVIEREHLRRILEEHELAGRGIVAALDQRDLAGRVLRADLLLVGSFAVTETGLRVETRLIRVADQEVLAVATWEGELEDVLLAAPRLCDELLESLGQPPDERRLAGIETQVPQTVDVARAYYRGVGAFEDGDYPEALGHYLEGAAHEHDFPRVDRAVIQMYYLLGQTAHAVVFADSVGRRLEREGHLRQSLEFTFAAAEHCLQSLDDPAAAIRFLKRMVAAAERHEEETHEFAATRDELVRRWPAEPSTAEQKRIQELRRRLAWGTAETGWWAHAAERSKDADSAPRQPEDPDVFMWGTRAQRDLARAYAAMGRTEESLELYREIVEDHEPLTRLPDEEMRRWSDSVRVEGHFMWLRHWRMTGTLDRDHALRGINKMNVVEDGFEFVRDFPNADIDDRARGASRYDDRGHEYFDFVCPEGFQIESVRLQTGVDGIAEYSFSVPDPDGWPPQISLGRRIRKFRYTRRGDYDETIDLPAGTELVSLSTSWGVNKYSDSGFLILSRRLLGPAAHEDIRRWSVTFEISPMAPGPVALQPLDHGPASGPTEADRKLIAQFAGRGGWELGAVLRGSSSATYSGTPALDVFAEEWVVCSLDGELFIHHRDRPLKVELPVAINTPEKEFRPRLVRTHEGSWALIWARGANERSARCFVAVTTDFLRWETPRRMQFAPAPPDAGLRSVALAGDYDVLPVASGYVMLLDNGQIRRSDDLRSWGPPTQVFDPGAWYGCLTKTEDGRLWAVYQTVSDVREPYEATDWLTGYYVTDGKRYKHMCEIHVAYSLDGIEWREFSKVVLPGQGSGLWAFPLADGRIGIGVQFNSRFMKWFATARSNTLRAIPSSLELRCHSAGASVFASDGQVACLVPMFDHYDTHRTVLMGVGSRRLFEDFQR